MLSKIADQFTKLPRSVQLSLFLLALVPMFCVGTIFNLGVLLYGIIAPNKRIVFPSAQDVSRRSGLPVGQ